MNQNRDKTQINWRYILIVLIFALLVGGWTIYYAYGTANAERKLHQGSIAQQMLLLRAAKPDTSDQHGEI